MNLETLKEKADSLLHLRSFVEKEDIKKEEKSKRMDEQLEINRLHSFLSHQ